jgi:hypothetical protein
MAYDASLVPINAFAGVPSDTARISGFGFYVGVTGDVAVMPSYQESKGTPTPVVFTAVPAGQIIPLVISRLMETDTTATDIVIFGPT